MRAARCALIGAAWPAIGANKPKKKAAIFGLPIVTAKPFKSPCLHVERIGACTTMREMCIGDGRQRENFSFGL